MYVALAARPLPKWFHLILSVLLFNLSCAIIYVYIMTRNITSSTERFETVPSYVIATLFFISGCLSLSMTKSVISESLRVAQVGVFLSMVTIVISLAGVVCMLWLADVQDKFVTCVYHSEYSQCLCRNDNVTHAKDENWYTYNRISGCTRLDALNRCMIASIALDAVGAFVCFLAFSNFGLIWVRRKTDHRRCNSAGSNLEFIGNAGSSGHRNLRQSTSVGSDGVPIPSPTTTTPGSHSDWDGWLFSHPLFRQMFSDLRHLWFPPTYEQSQMENSDVASVEENSPPSNSEESTSQRHPDAHCNSRRDRDIEAPPSGTNSMLTVALGDYPPPPYSKNPKQKRLPSELKRTRSLPESQGQPVSIAIRAQLPVNAPAGGATTSSESR